MSIYWDPYTNDWYDTEGEMATEGAPRTVLDDYVVTESGLLRNTAGQLGTFQNGTWTPFNEGSDIASALSAASNKNLPQQLKRYVGKLFSGEGSTADYGTAIAGLLGLYEQMNKDRSPKMWEGKVEKTPYTAPTVTPQYQAAIQQRPYGERLMGMNPFSYTGGISSAAPAPTESIFARRPETPVEEKPVTTMPVAEEPMPASGVSKLLPVPEKYTAAAPAPAPAAPAVQQQAAPDSTPAAPAVQQQAAPDSTPAPGAASSATSFPGERIWSQEVLEHAREQNPNVYAQMYASMTPEMQAAENADEAGRRAVQEGIDRANDPAWQIANYGYVFRPQQNESHSPVAASAQVAPPPESPGMAQGGIAMLARGGRTNSPRYLRGQTDGMADKIPSNIDGVQPAKLSHGEFVIPADVVSHLGNGNSDAGAKVLYKMMDRVRQARTGTKKQGKQINPEKFTPGGIAGYAGGGAVAFNVGGTAVNAAGTGGTLTGGLSPYIGDYVAGPQGYLSKAWGLSEKPYEAYQGPLTAGLSPLQQQAIGDYGNLQVPGAMGTATQTAGDVASKFGTAAYSPVGSAFTAQQAQAYMNPYLQAALDPQLRELTRQSDIARMSDAARLSQAGAFGGSRQAIMESEGRRNLLGKQADVLGQGYATAYDKAMQQFNADQARKVQEAQYGTDFGLKALQGQLGAAQAQSGLAQAEFGTGLQGLTAQMSAGAVQRGAEQEAVEAGIRQWQEAQKYPYEQLKFQQSMIQGLPVSTSTTTPNTSMFSDLISGVGGLLGLYERLGKAGG